MAIPEAPCSRPEARPAAGGGLVRFWELFKHVVKTPIYRLYEHRLESKAAGWTVPRHIGFIMDGNRRFARSLGLQTVSDGHRQGAEKLWEVLSWCYDAGVRVVTVWSFSLENFQRDTAEVKALLELFEVKTKEIAEHREVHSKRVRVRYIGELGLLPESLQEAIRKAEAATAAYDGYVLNIAMAYGGREEITEAIRRYLRDRIAAGDPVERIADELDGAAIGRHLYTSGLPEPDLILRTSGEVRLSGFLLWQSAYSEYYFSDTHWPAFRKIDFLRALRSYHERHRRFGR
jgi:short-chain Z-isoprenyl diphosphate synthase